MKSIEGIFCEANCCEAEQFPEKVFWRCLHRRAFLLAPLLGGFRSAYFATDRAMILAVGRAFRMDQVREEVNYYCTSPENHGWLRRAAKIRVSGRRLLQLASRHLSANEASSASLAPTAGTNPPVPIECGDLFTVSAASDHG